MRHCWTNRQAPVSLSCRYGKPEHLFRYQQSMCWVQRILHNLIRSDRKHVQAFCQADTRHLHVVEISLVVLCRTTMSYQQMYSSSPGLQNLPTFSGSLTWHQFDGVVCLCYQEQELAEATQLTAEHHHYSVTYRSCFWQVFITDNKLSAAVHVCSCCVSVTWRA